MAEKQYWKGIEELNRDPDFVERQQNEFREELPVLDEINRSLSQQSTKRRDFLKTLGYSLSAAAFAASCEMPVRKSIPYVIKPDKVTPGKASYYASTISAGGDFTPVLVKTREGRPIKIEPNQLSHLTPSGTGARAQASVLSLYDGNRLKGPKIDGKDAKWEDVDKEITQALGGTIRILSNTMISPSTKSVIKDFKSKYGQTKHVAYDPVSYAGLLTANKQTFGKRVIPAYHFNNAQVIVSFNADFLGTWLSPLQFSSDYAINRKVSPEKPEMSKHYHLETTLSVTGSNADERMVINPSQEGLAVLHLYNELAAKAGQPTVNAGKLDDTAFIKKAAEDLWANKGQSLVVGGSNDPDVQLVINQINRLLDNYGTTLDIDNPSYQKQGSDQAVQDLIGEMKAGKVDALIVYDANPAYDLPNVGDFQEAIKNVTLTISFNDRMDETTSLVKYACPDHHQLESWNDYRPQAGYYSLGQPTIAPLFNTRQAQESLLKWSGSDINFHDYLQQYWEKNLFNRQNQYSSKQHFWDKTLQDGVFKAQDSNSQEKQEEQEAAPEDAGEGSMGKTLSAAASGIRSRSGKGEGFELVLFETVAIGDGRGANNPWLQEMPDPISKVVWDNFVAVSPKDAEEQGLQQDDVVKVSANGYSVSLPVNLQPGQKRGTIGIALGYGREKAGKAGNAVGKNAFPFLKNTSNGNQYFATDATIEKTGKKHPLAQTQTHHNLYDGISNRKIVKEATLDEYKENPAAGNEDREKIKSHLQTLYNSLDENGHAEGNGGDHGNGHNGGEHQAEKAAKHSGDHQQQGMYGAHQFPGHHWGMSIDLNSCLGCGACTVACQAENNVPVVGKAEVLRHHEMDWIRIDRYFSGDTENPEVVFQPMMCQHCDNAPCENVCPVAATMHSAEGLNQMAYNRCVGTRYCANNCPYKVRRFNWYDYQGADSFNGKVLGNEELGFTGDNLQAEGMLNSLTRMVLNPDVTVRSRGVMEKCSFCVQRIQESKLEAKKENRKLTDGDVKTACQTACPTNAISFGDRNDENAEVYQTFTQNERAYGVIEQIHTLPSVHYLTKIRNKKNLKIGNQGKQDHNGHGGGHEEEDHNNA